MNKAPKHAIGPKWNALVSIECDAVREALAAHHRTPPEVLNVLVHDGHPDVIMGFFGS